MNNADPFKAWVIRSEAPTSIDARGGPLAGMRFGVKDIIDVAGMPTAYGVDFVTTHPHLDAWCVAALRAAGATPAGKTQTTAFAFRDPAVTRNPRDPSRSPGGSSAGSAAAVAAGDVPLALGTQTLGSVLRPAAYCGVVGFKPSWGRIPPVGVSPCAPSLDTVGLIASDVATTRRAAEALIALDDSGPASPRLGIAIGYMSELIEPETRAAIDRAVMCLHEGGIDIASAALPSCVEESPAFASRLQAAETWMACGAWLAGKPIPPYVAKLLADGRAIDAAGYRATRTWREMQRPRVAAIFDNLDALIVPAANLAPAFGTTGDPTPLSPWTFFGLPAIALPIGDDPETKLPFAFQIVAPYGADGRLLDIAARVEAVLARAETVASAARS